MKIMTTTTTRPPAVSSLRLFGGALQLAAKVYGRVLAHGFGLLTFLHLLEAGAGQFFSYATDYMHQTGREDLLLIAMIAMLELLISMLWSAAWALAVFTLADEIWRGQNRAPKYRDSFIQHFNQIVIEQVRALAAVLWRVPLLILPAVVEYVRLSFVPLVVIFNHGYGRGAVDALQESRALSRGRFWALTMMITASLLTPWAAQSMLQGDDGELLWHNPVGVALSWAVTLFINVFSALVLWGFFRKLDDRTVLEAAT